MRIRVYRWRLKRLQAAWIFFHQPTTNIMPLFIELSFSRRAFSSLNGSDSIFLRRMRRSHLARCAQNTMQPHRHNGKLVLLFNENNDALASSFAELSRQFVGRDVISNFHFCFSYIYCKNILSLLTFVYETCCKIISTNEKFVAIRITNLQLRVDETLGENTCLWYKIWNTPVQKFLPYYFV